MTATERRMYLSAKNIKTGIRGEIDGEPGEVDVVIDGEEKTLFRIPITLDVPIRDDYKKSDTDLVSWAAGKNARTFLESTLGTVYTDWIGTVGHFEPRQWVYEEKSGFAWHFVPDAQKAPQDKPPEEDISPPIPPPSSVTNTTEAEYRGGKHVATYADGEKVIVYNCPRCASSFTDRNKMVSHMNNHEREATESRAVKQEKRGKKPK